jgi:hypothetical protein
MIMNKQKIFSGLVMVSALLGANVESARAELVGGATMAGTHYSYPDYGGGDFTFALVTPINDCVGAWISPIQPGAKAAVAIVTASLVMSRSLNITVDRAVGWPGSSAKYCKVYAVGLASQ